MSDTEPTTPAPSSEPPEPAPATTVQPSRLRDRLFGLRALIAVAVAGVVLGGLAGFGINAATDGQDRDGRMGRFGPGGFPGGPGQGPGGPGGPGGQRPPGPGQQGPGSAPSSVPSPS